MIDFSILSQKTSFVSISVGKRRPFKHENHFQITAYPVLGQYLVLKKDAELFKEWMKDTCNASAKQANDCYNCLNDEENNPY
uniref:Uncharacterized protein n=1 Tax=Glossina palpalis gambiensis TaxID=67801 RepID=A0A1B0BZL6_9MUSC